MQEFMELGLSDAVAKAFATLGFDAPTEIQKLAIPALLERRDAYVSSATGTGKTFAYLAPVLASIDTDEATLRAIIVTPTHDLAAQIERETLKLSIAANLAIRVVSALGSVPLRRQLERLSQKPHIVVGSAGRIRDLVLAGHLNLSNCQWAVLDEADRLFENEAIDITTELLSSLPDACNRLLVSASLPNRTVERSAAWFRDALRLVVDPAEALRETIEHWCFHSASRSKLDFLRRFEAAVKPERCLLFASSNASIFNIQKRLDFLGFPAVVLKSDKDGNERRDALSEFSNGSARWMITTDLGARGLDLPDVSHVISFDLPEEPSVYMHRAGRTGRAGKHGVSIALADLVELRRASRIAVRYGFPFVCKILDSGVVHDIEPENFFAIAEEEEVGRKDVKLEGTKRPDPRRRNRPAVQMERPRRNPGDEERTQRRDPSRSSNRPPARHSKRDPGKDPRTINKSRQGPSSSAPSATPNPVSGPAPMEAVNTQKGQATRPTADPSAQKKRHRRRKPGSKDVGKSSSE